MRRDRLGREIKSNRDWKLTDAEIARRIALAMKLKHSVEGRSLTDAELDQYLAPIDCKRTRNRLAGGAVRQ
jgi:hypothetical protein